MGLFSNKHNSFRKISSDSGDEAEAFLHENAQRKLENLSEQQHKTWKHYLTWPVVVHTAVLFIWVTIAIFVIQATSLSSQGNLLLSYCM